MHPVLLASLLASEEKKTTDFYLTHQTGPFYDHTMVFLILNSLVMVTIQGNLPYNVPL